MTQKSKTSKTTEQPTSNKFAPGYHQGIACGYDVKPDGRISLPPIFTDRMLANLDKHNGLRNMLAFVHHGFSQLAAEDRKLRREALDDLGLDLKGDCWEFNSNDGCIRRRIPGESADKKP